MRLIFSLQLLLVCQCIWAGSGCDEQSFDQTVSKYLKLEIEQNWEALYKMRTSAFRKEITYDSFFDRLSSNVNEVWLAEYKLEEVIESEGYCLIDVELMHGFIPGVNSRLQRRAKGSNALTELVVMKWIKEQNDWRYVSSDREYQPFND